MFFSPCNYRLTKPLANKMGLETGWNCAISLREQDELGMKNLGEWDLKAKLPHGIPAIRSHLDNVDNVPLLVSLFTDSAAVSTREMISIMQDNGEVVCALGSAMGATNADLLSQADIAVAVENDTIRRVLSQHPAGIGSGDSLAPPLSPATLPPAAASNGVQLPPEIASRSFTGLSGARVQLDVAGMGTSAPTVTGLLDDIKFSASLISLPCALVVPSGTRCAPGCGAGLSRVAVRRVTDLPLTSVCTRW